MKIKTNTGFGLVGTLAVSMGVLTMGMGALKLNLISLNKAKIENTGFSENNLKKATYDILSDQTKCINNLNPSTNPENTNLESNGNITSLDDNGNKVIKVGYFDKNIKIVSIRLTGTGNNRILYLYYIKPALGDKQTRGGQPCTKGPPEKLSGCYYLSYEINYECIGGNCGENRTLTKCQINNERTCPENNLLTGINNQGGQDCGDLPFQHEIFPQPTNQIINSFKKISITDSALEIQTTDLIPIIKKCPPGQYPVRIIKNEGQENEEIDIKCQILCTGGSKLNEVTNLCECDINTEYKKGRCEECPGGASRSASETKCTCDKEYLSFEGSTYCKCQHPTPYEYNNKCNKCLESRYEWADGSCHKCPRGQYFLVSSRNISGECLTCPSDSDLHPNLGCRCRNGKRWQYVYTGRNECKCVLGSYPYKGRCIRCPSGSVWSSTQKKCKCSRYGKTRWDDVSNTCECPLNKPKYYDYSCHECPRNEHFHHGGCYTCTRDYFHSGSCRSCTVNYFYHGSCHSCTSNYFYNERCNVCPFNKKHSVFGYCRRCPRNRYHHHNSQCNHCPSGQPHYYRNNCWYCPENRRLRYGNNCVQCPRTAPHARGDKCCPNAGGACCMPGYHINSRGNCEKNNKSCSLGYHYDFNIGKCCKNGYNHAGHGTGICCPDGYHYTNGTCCQNGYYHPPGSNICCRDGSVFSNGSCCPSNEYTFDIASQMCWRNSQ